MTGPRAAPGRIGLFWEEPDPDAGPTVGRGVAAEAFLEALLRHGRRYAVDLFCPGVQERVLRPRLAPLFAGGRGSLHAQEILRDGNGAAEPAAWHDVQFDTDRPFRLRARRRRPFPVTLLHHSVSYKELLHQRFLPLLLHHTRPFDSLVCTSRAARDAVRALLDHVAARMNRDHGTSLAFGGRLDLIPLGVDTERFRPREAAGVREKLGLPPDAFVLLWVGRRSAIDKADLLPLVKVFASLLRKHPQRNPYLVLAGGEHPWERYGEKLRAYAEALEAGDRVRLSAISAGDLPRLYNAADVLVSPADNLQESFGLAPVEAMASGIPQVVSDWNGYRDTVVHGETGLLVPVWWAPADRDLAEHAYLSDSPSDHLALAQSAAVDPGELEGALETLLENEDLRRRMGARSRERAEAEFAWPRVIARYEDLWGELSGEARREPEREPDALPGYAVPDYFAVFGHYASRRLASGDGVRLTEAGAGLLEGKEALPLFAAQEWNLFDTDVFERILLTLSGGKTAAVNEVLRAGEDHPDRVFRHLLWLLKYGYVRPAGP